MTLQEIETLYGMYYTSFPDKKQAAIFPAQSEEEMTLHDLIYNPNRSILQHALDTNLLNSIKSGELQYPDDRTWFWQSQIYPNFILPKKLFETHAYTVKPKIYDKQIPDLHHKSIAVRRLRQYFNPEQTTVVPMTFRDCFESIIRSQTINAYHITNTNMFVLLSTYKYRLSEQQKKWLMNKIYKFNTMSKSQKLALCKTILKQDIHLSQTFKNKEWFKIHEQFINDVTFEYIKTFITFDTSNTFGSLVSYLNHNQQTIMEYINTH